MLFIWDEGTGYSKAYAKGKVNNLDLACSYESFYWKVGQQTALKYPMHLAITHTAMRK